MSVTVEHIGSHGTPPPSLSQRNFPRRVRMLLEGTLKFVSDEMERGLSASLNELEQQLFKLAEQARSNEVQQRCFESLREIKRTRGDLVPRFLIGLEAGLATIQDPPKQGMAEPQPLSGELSLVAETDFDETTELREIATRAEIRSSLPLFLLGQRFGVIAGRPAFDAETLPIGPHALCRILRSSAACLGVGQNDRVLFYRQFERLVLARSNQLMDIVNDYLIGQHILPTLTFVPVRARKSVSDDSRSADADSKQKAAKPAARGKSPPVDAPLPKARSQADPVTPVPASPMRRSTDTQELAPFSLMQPAQLRQGSSDAPELDQQMFDALRQLLSGRRNLLGKLGGKSPVKNGFTVSRDHVQSVLGKLQSRPAQHTSAGGKTSSRTVQHVKQDLLAQLRSIAPEDKAPQLEEEDADAIDLVGMLFENLMQDVRPNSAAADLLTQLQVPLLRLAIEDKAFFSEREHPARQMLNSIAETGAQWVGEDEVDRSLIDKMRMLVDKVSSEYDGDPKLFNNLLGDLSGHLELVKRKAEVAERRHVEAARGKEKLELSRLHAAQAIDGLLKGRPVPKFLHTLLAQAWTDVLALTMLRQGEDSDAFRLQMHVARRLVDSASSRESNGKALIGSTEADKLGKDIEKALAQVGYHSDDAAAISTRLLSLSKDDEQDDPASRTELVMRLKSRTRLGGNQTEAAIKPEKAKPLTDAEKARVAELRKLPFGTWFEFTTNQQGDRVRRRMSWYSTVTGHSLFVNHRGQRIGEYSLDWLAREMERGQVSIVESGQDNMIDRAWKSIMKALRSFSGSTPAHA